MPNKKLTKKGDLWVDGKKTGVVLTNNRGFEKSLLNPHGKFVKYSNELSEGVRLTNDGHLKMGRFGPERLSDDEIKYREGYCNAMRDQAKAFNSQRRGGNR